ncbi:hypothetical protein AN958_12700 [Leucoagaricus sp. SymC.cos]|nr:hypothetical protein AN958_12700 [Leucoagaricus sp. SymC.cos]
MTYPTSESRPDLDQHLQKSTFVPENKNSGPLSETEVQVEVPTFVDRTRYMRRGLALVEARLRDMGIIKTQCDREAHRGAKRLAVGGFAMLVVYWAVVARLTFWDYGWFVAAWTGVQWSESADVGEFRIVMTHPTSESRPDLDQHLEKSTFVPENKNSGPLSETEVQVEVPTFVDRTRYMRRGLALVEVRLRDVDIIKTQCDREAHRGAKRLAVGGFVMLVVYWAAVARLTFWDYG